MEEILYDNVEIFISEGNKEILINQSFLQDKPLAFYTGEIKCK